MKSVKTNKLYVFVKLETVRNDIINLKNDLVYPRHFHLLSHIIHTQILKFGEENTCSFFTT
jgi:hypothetical protein